MEQKQLRHCVSGEFIKCTETAKTVWIRWHYDRGTKTFSLIDAEDCNREIFLKPSAMVWVGFDY